MSIQASDITGLCPGNLRESVTSYFRDRIRRGELHPGERLPTNRELAALLGTSAPNIHAGLSPLLKEGLIHRDRKNGTVVAERPRQLRCVAIYIHHSSLDDLPPFQRTLIELLRVGLEQRNIEPRLVTDNDLQYGYRQLRSWAESAQIQGVLLPFHNRNREVFDRLRALPVLLSATEDNTSCGRVDLDHRAMLGLGLQALKEQGATRIGFLTSSERFAADGVLSAYHRLYHREAARLGLEAPPELVFAIRTAADYLRSSDSNTDFAYEQCERLFSRPRQEWPDGLLVIPDQLSTGLMFSLLQHRIDVPGELKLVIHRNWEISRTLLTPCRQVGVSIAAVAAALIENLRRGFEGLPPRKVVIVPEVRSFTPSNERRS